MATFTSPITLLEVARAGRLSVLDQALVNKFAVQWTGNSDRTFFEVLPFKDLPGALGYEFQRELGLPTITPTDFNATLTRSVGSTEKVVEHLKKYPAEIIMDLSLLRTAAGQAALAQQLAMAGKAILEKYMLDFFKGDEATTPAGITGLQARCTGSQLNSEGSTSGGDPLQLAELDETIDMVNGPNKVIFMCKGLKRRIDAAARTPSVGGNVWYQSDEWGRRQAFYKELPIISVADFNGDDNILGFNEAGAGGGTTATSLYVVSLDEEEGVCGLRNGFLDPHGVAESSAEPGRIDRLTGLFGLAVKKIKAAARHYGISDAAVIA